MAIALLGTYKGNGAVSSLPEFENWFRRPDCGGAAAGVAVSKRHAAWIS